MNYRSDLHVHSRWSDGSQSVEEIFKEAKKIGLNQISLTDHDTTAGTEEALYWGQKLGIHTVPGIEISAMDRESGKPVHLLGYYYRRNAHSIEKLCSPVLKQRHQTTLKQADILEKEGYLLNREMLWEEAGDAPVLYKQHIMQILVKQGHCKSIFSPLYKKLFKGEGPCNLSIEYIDIIDAVQAVIQDGGLPVLAHPGLQDSFHLVPQLVELGLWGIELYHEANDMQDRLKIQALAKEFNLQLTGGSDTHGTYGSMFSLGEIQAPRNFTFPDSRELPYRMNFIKPLIESCAEQLRNLAGEIIDQKHKGEPDDLVTHWDKYVESQLVDTIRDEFPDDGFITEEADRGGSMEDDFLWIIDPIDGTTNFIHRGKDFAISVACYKKGKPWFGLVYDVVNQELYEAVSGQGAWVNGVSQTLAPKRELKNSIVDFSMNSIHIMKERFQIDLSKLKGHIRGHRALGAASIIICKIATGDTDIYLSAKLHLWDYAAADIFLKECHGCSELKKSEIYIAASNETNLEQFKRVLNIEL